MGYTQTFLLLFIFAIISQASSSYDVHWLSGPTVIERDTTTTFAKKSVDIYCYPGTSKSILSLWQSVKFHIKIQNEEYNMYTGDCPEAVFKEYTEDSYGWSVVNPFQRKPQRSLSVSLFSPTCMILSTKHKHSVELQIIRVDIWRVLLTVVGLVTIFMSRTLSGNPVFFYLCGMLVGVTASFMVLVYYVSKLLPRKTLTYGLLIGGWTVGVYIFQQVWENVRGIIASYQTYAFWYTLVASFASFLVCYKIGPPRNERSKNIVMWILQASGVLMVFFSSEYQEASAAGCAAALAAKYFPAAWALRIKGYWLRRFPPKPRLLTSEQYYEQGARETKEALDSLRKYCASPDCKQWSVMLKVNDSKRFASFVEGNSHLSDDEVLDYESYAFSMERKRKPTPVANSTTHDLEISEDDSSDDEDL